MRAPTGDQGLNTTHRFVQGNGSALCDLDTPGAGRDLLASMRDPPFASISEGRDCFHGTGYSLIEEVYVFQDGRPVPIK